MSFSFTFSKIISLPYKFLTLHEINKNRTVKRIVIRITIVYKDYMIDTENKNEMENDQEVL